MLSLSLSAESLCCVLEQICCLVLVQSLSLSLSLRSIYDQQHLSSYLSMFVELVFYYLYITGSDNTCSFIAGDD